MNLLNLFKKFKAEDLEKENNQLKSVDKISVVEAWELEKTKDKPKDFFTFHKEMSAKNQLED